MAEAGSVCLILAFSFSLYVMAATGWGIARKSSPFLKSAEGAVIALFAFVTIASAVLIHLLFSRNFQIAYVAETTSRTLSPLYTFAAFWGGQAGSLLLWTWILSLFAFIVVLQAQKKPMLYIPYVLGIIAFVQCFFLILVNFVANPFMKLAFIPPDGRGLNPLLQNPWMAIHPPSLYIGFVSVTIPFAFAMAALLSGNLSTEWIRAVRKWTLFAWLFLTLGNLFGARWAYLVLGWGGYWGWDPVENAAIIPWFVTTAYLHSVMIQEKRDMLKVWNFFLIILAFLLTIFGTFITRSGLISSVHSFAQSNIGPYFALFLTILTAGSFGLLTFRLKDLKSENRLDAFLSRESTFLFNNLLLLGVAFAIFWGTVFPMVSEALQGLRTAVGPPFYHQVVTPIGLVLLLLMGIGPVMAWRRSSLSLLARNFLGPLVATGIGSFLLYLFGVKNSLALLSFSLCIFVGGITLQEFYRGARVWQKQESISFWQGLLKLFAKNRRRYGGYVVHIGVILIFVGITGNVFNVEKEASVKRGESFAIRDYTLKYAGFDHYPTPQKYVITTTLAISKKGNYLKEIETGKYFFPRVDQPMTQVSIVSSLREDLYVILAGFEKDGRAIFKVFVNPLVRWVWVGGAMMVLGALLLLFPEKWFRSNDTE